MNPGYVQRSRGFPVQCTGFLLGLALVAGQTGCMPRLGDTEAALALEDIAAGNGSRLQARTPAPTRETLDYTIDGRRYTGDVYLSPAGSRAGIVLVPGVVPAGKDDVRLVALATTLARVNFTVLVPDLRGVRKYRVRKNDVTEVADAFRFLLSRPDWVPQDRAGIGGFSYGAGPVLLAALEPDIRKRVRFIMTLGGYYDLRSIVTYFTTGFYRDAPGTQWRYRAPSPYIKWVFTLSNTDLLDESGDRAALRALANDFIEDTEVEFPTRPKGLRPDAQALYELLVNEDPDRVGALIERLSPRIRTELAGLDPAVHDLSQLQAQVILVHGRGDTMIPYTESLALARNLPARQVQLFLIEGLAHVDVKPQQQDIPQLLAAMEALLAQRMPMGAQQ